MRTGKTKDVTGSSSPIVIVIGRLMYMYSNKSNIFVKSGEKNVMSTQ